MGWGQQFYSQCNSFAYNCSVAICKKLPCADATNELLVALTGTARLFCKRCPTHIIGCAYRASFRDRCNSRPVLKIHRRLVQRSRNMISAESIVQSVDELHSENGIELE